MAKQSGTTKSRRDKDFLRKPQYEGGVKALRKFISDNLAYPEEALAKRIQGDVHIKYDVDEHGAVISAKVVRAIGGGCDEEALRLVNMLKYIPARNRGAHVTTHHDVVIHFRLPLQHLAPHVPTPMQRGPQPVVMSYTYVSQSPATEDTANEAPSPVVFTWTVRPNS